jgi:hypothetical protein
VFQGEGQFQHENTLIGTLQIGPMEPKPAQFHKFQVVFNLDKNGLLSMKIIHLNENKKIYEAHFDQRTGVGGDEALIAFRNRLLAMYAGSPSRVYEPPPPSKPSTWPGYPYSDQAQPKFAGTPPNPDVHQICGCGEQGHVPSPGGHGLPGGSPPGAAKYPPTEVSMPGRAAATVPTPSGGAVGPTSGQAPVASTTAQAAQAAQVPAPCDQGIHGFVEALVPVPEQFMQVVRRSRKQLNKKLDPRLLESLNVFIDALNRGVGGVERDVIGDDLADSFDAARK